MVPSTPRPGRARVNRAGVGLNSQAHGTQRSTVACAGVPIVAVTRQAAADDVLRLATEERASGLDVHLCNAYTLALADGDDAFRRMLGVAGRNYPDGMSVVWANRLRHGRHLPSERVYGPDLFLDVLDQGQAMGVRHYLLGGSPNALEHLQTSVSQRFPRANVVGAETPPFRALTGDERAEQIQRLTAAQPHIVWVGLGTPKQDWEAARLAREVSAVFVAVGAAFDFVAGTKKQAPVWMQDRGLEWAYRLGTEPRRLWKRYLIGNARFVYAAARRGA